MTNREISQILVQNVEHLTFDYEYVSGANFPYRVHGIHALKKALNKLSTIQFLEQIIGDLKKSKLYESDHNMISFERETFMAIKEKIDYLKYGSSFFISHFYSSFSSPIHSLSVKLPPVKTFDDLAKISNEFKKALEIPLLDSKIESNLEINSVENGSIWLIIGVGTTVAVKLIAAITWSAAYYKKKISEAKIFEAHAKTLELKNEQIQILLEAQKKKLNDSLKNESEAVANKFYIEPQPEEIQRLKSSINIVSELIDKGAKILPTNEEDEIIKLFPDYSNPLSIESMIKKIPQSLDKNDS